MSKIQAKLIVIFMLLGIGIAAIAGQVMADDDDFGRRISGARDVAQVNNILYTKECGSCHFAYQPGLLPARSWKRLIAGLEDHFGDNAELMDEDQLAITTYLVNNSADFSGYKASKKIMQSLNKNMSPIRITDTPYFIHEHDEIQRAAWADNPKVKSLSYCNRCHTRAEAGSFNEHDVMIPGFGNWDD
ncbi:MAG: diheme cytochrome c [Nitrospinota bacterium]